MKINWKQKLSSRKFWMAVVGFVTSLLYAFNWADSDIETVTAIIMSGATLISYILAEGFIDAKREESYKVTDNYNRTEYLDSK